MADLSGLIDLLASGSVSLELRVCDAEELEDLKGQLLSIREELRVANAERQHLERRYMYESDLNNRLIDWIREQGLEVPRGFYGGILYGGS